MNSSLSTFVERTKEIVRDSYSESKLESDLNHVIKEMLSCYSIDYKPAINESLKMLGLSTMSSSRPDSLFGHVVLDFKKPGTFSSISGIKQAQKQVQNDYLDVVTGGHLDPTSDCEAWAGIVWDGEYISFCHSNGVDWHWTKPNITSEASMLSLIQTYRGLEKKPLTSKLLCKEFGKNNKITIKIITILCAQLENPAHRTNILFQEWKRLFEQVSTYNLAQIPSLDSWARTNKIQTNDASKILFALHTYYSIVVKLLTSELLSASSLTIGYSLVEEIINATGYAELKKLFVKLEDSDHYKDYRITNLLEGDFFSWYVNEDAEELFDCLLEIANKLFEFEPATAKLKPKAVKDLLKEFY